MMERWLQISCDGCGATECNTSPNQSASDFRWEQSHSGWRKRGRRDYCGQCVKDGTARRGETIFGAGPGEAVGDG
jgi:hypothetical protein